MIIDMLTSQQTTCTKCGKDTDGLMTCTFPDNDNIERLCPDCLKADGDFCFCCGMFSSGTEGFDIIHPGYCNECWDEIAADDDDEDESIDHSICVYCGAENVEITPEADICHSCGYVYT